MILADLKKILDQTGFPVTYSHFSSPPSVPYITYLIAYTSNVFADDQVYKKIDNAQIELYTNKKDLASEKKLEDVLDANGIPYETTETFIESEQLFQRIYEVRLI